MCDCFHAVLPWPGAPGSVSGQQLEPQEPETEEEHSVTAGPVDEVIRPRPQGSSPVYECRTEGTSFGLQEDAPGRRGASGRRRSWWKRDSRDSQTLSRMSRPEEATEVTLETEVEAGASGYSVTGGGHQGIFVKQVLRDSSAAKLFNLQAGDQLLSATVFFDEIKYEDALKILQYSEPYRVQFKLRRRLPAADAGGRGSSGSQRLPAGEEKQDKDIADVCPETPTKTLEGDGDQERLISQAREGRGRRPQKERRSWPKFQALKSTRGTGPRRSHSSSEASERRDAPDVSPGSTDTEAQAPAEHLRQKGHLETRHLSIQLPSADLDVQQGQVDVTRPERQRPEAELREPQASAAGLRGRLPQIQMPGVKMPRVEPQGPQADIKGPKVDVTGAEGDMEVSQPSKDVDIQACGGKLETDLVLGDKDLASKGSKFKMPKFKMPSFGTSTPRKTVEVSVDKTMPVVGADVTLPSFQGDLESGDLSTQLPSADLDIQSVQGDTSHPEDQLSGVEVSEAQVAGTRLKGHLPRVQTPSIKMPKVGLRGPQVDIKGPDMDVKSTKGTVSTTAVEVSLPSIDADAQAPGAKVGPGLAMGDKEVTVKDSKFRMPKFKMPSFGASTPRKTVQASVDVPTSTVEAAVTLVSFQGDLKTTGLSIQLPPEPGVQPAQGDVRLPEAQLPHMEVSVPQASAAGPRGHLPKVPMPSIRMPKVGFQGPQVDIGAPKVDVKGSMGEVSTPDLGESLPSVDVDMQAPSAQLEADLDLGEKAVAAKDSKFRLPRFRMPSFGTSTTGKTTEAPLDVTTPKVEADLTLPSFQGDVKTPDLSVQLPSADVKVQPVQLGGKVPEGQQPEAELPTPQASAAGPRGQLPKVPMPSIRMPKVGLQGPQVDIGAPKVDVKGSMGEVSAPDLGESLPSVDVDMQAPGAQLEMDLSLGDKDVAIKDGKFKLPKLKMPSFGASTPGKTVQAAVGVAAPKVEGDVTLGSLHGELETTDLSIRVPSSELGVQPAQGDVRLPEAQLPDMEVSVPQASAADPRGHLPKVPMPSIRMPKVGLQGPQVDIRAPKVDVKGSMGEVSAPDLGVSLPSVDVDMQAPSAQLEADLDVGEKAVAAKDSKFRLPRFRMPSFGTSTTGKTTEAPLDVTTPKVEADLTLPSFQGDVKTPDLSVQLPSADVKVQPVQLGGKVPEGQQPEAELPTPQASAAGPRGQLPKVPMPSIRMPKVGLQGPQVDIGAPKVDVKGSMGEVSAPDLGESLPSVDVDMQAPGAQLEMDLSLGDKDVTIKDGKFKLPKLKMPSFGASTPGKTVQAAVGVAAPKVEGDVTLGSLHGELETTDLSIRVPSSELGVQPAQGDVRLPEAQLPDMEVSVPQASAADPRGHLPKVPMPSIRMPKVGLQGPQVDIRAPKVDVKGSMGEVSAPDLGESLPSVDVDMQAPDVKMEADLDVGEKAVTAKDSKFKLPRFRMPSFGVPDPGKIKEASVDMTTAKVETDVTLASFQGDLKTTGLSIQLPPEPGVQPAQGDVRLPEAQLPDMELSVPQASAAGPRGHLPKVPMPSIRMPKVGLQGPQVDIGAPKVDVKGSMGEVSTPDLDLSLPSVDVDMQAPSAQLEADLDLGEKAVAAKDSKFRLPRFRMPSFGTSTTGKTTEAPLDVTTPKVEADLTLPSFQGDVKTPDLSVQLPSADVKVQPVQLGGKVPEGQQPEAELPTPQASAAGPRGQLPKVPMPSIRMPKVGLQGPQVDIGAPKVDVKGSMGEVSTPDLGVSLPSVDVDMQAPDVKLEADLDLGEKAVTAKDSKFRLPRFRMPSFGVPDPGKIKEASVDMTTAKVETDVTLASFQGDLKTTGLSIQLPPEPGVQPAQGDVRLPEAQLPDMELSVPQASAAGPRGHLPKVPMPSIRMPKVGLQGPQVDIRAPKVDVKGSMGEVSTPDLGVSLPSVDVDMQAPGAQLEMDLSLGDKDVAIKDGKFKLPKLKMPSFGASTPGKTVQAAVGVAAPKVEGDVTLGSLHGELETTDLSIRVPSSELGVQPAQGDVRLPEAQLPDMEVSVPQASAADPRGHLPKVPMPSIRMPKVGLQGPQVDIRAPKVDVKGSMGEVSAPDLGESLPSVDVDMQAPGAQLEADLDLGEKAVAAKDSKFRLPRFRMPSFGTSTTGKTTEAPLDVTTPKVEADLTLPSFQGDVKTPDLSVQLPSADVKVQPVQLGGKVPEGQQPEAELPTPQASAAGPRGQLPKVPMPSIRMPKVGLQGPQVDIGAPKVDVKGSMGEVSTPDLGVSLPSVDVDMQAPGAQLEMDPSLGHQDVSIKDNKFKMPSFGTSAPGKTVEALLDKTVLMVEADLTRPSLQGDLETTDLSIQRPSSHPEVQPGQVSVRLPEGPQPETGLPPPQASEAGLKGHLPNAPSITGAQVDIRSPSEVARCAKAEVGAPGMLVSLPCTDLGIRAPGVEGTSLGDKEVTVKDSKFRTPKLQMPSSGASTPRRTEEVSVGVPTSAAETAVALPPHCGDLRSIELGSRLPSADQEVQPGQLCVQPPEGQPPGTELSEPQPQASGLRGHLPGAQMPSIKVPRVDLKGPQVAITGLEVDMKGAKEEVSTPDLEASLPSADVAIQAPGVKVETDLALGRPSPPPPSSSRGPVSSSTLEGSLEHIAAAPSAARSPGAGAALPEARVPVQAETQALGSAAQDSSERLPGPGDSPFPLVPPSALATSSIVRTAQAPGQVPQVALPSAPSASVDVTGGHVSTSRGHVRLTEHQVALPPATLAPPPPQDAAFGSQVSAPPSSVGSSAAPQCPGRVPTSQTAGPLPAAHGRVTFPKFHKPKFGFSSPKATVPEVDLRAEVRAPALPAGDPTGAVGGVAGEGGPSSPPGSELRSSGVSARAPKGAPSEAPDQEGKGSPFRAPGWTLPSQSRALEQDRGPTGDPEGSWEDSDAEHTDAQPKGPGSHADTHGHRPPEAQGEKSRRGLPTARASEGQAAAALPSPAAKGGVGATERASSAGGGSSSGASGGGAVSRRLPQARFPSLGFVKLDRRSSKATAEVSRAEAKPRLPAHTAAAGSGSGGPGPTEEGTAPPGEDLPQPPCGKPGAGLPGEDAPAEATPVSAQESRFKMPKLHVPGFRRTRSKDRGEAAEQEAPGGAGSPLSGPEAQAGAAPQPPDTKAGAAAASEGVSSVGVPQCPPQSTGVMLSEISTQPAEGSPPLQGLGTRPSGRQAEAPVESWPSPPQGPVRLTASRTDVPAQVSVVSTHQLWQDSVLTVKFPTWKGPRFAFPAPGSEADVFVPAVRQVRGSVAGAGEALSEGRAGLWAASILPAATEVFGEQPVCLDPSSGPPPISQVRVHFQRAPAESQGMVLRSGASPAPADPVETEAISTEIVRESEIPTSRVQTPSYGFSLLKVKIPERRARAVCTVPGGSEAPAAGGSVSGPVPPDSAEPFEAVPSGGHPLGPAEDEEPAAEEDREAAEAGAAPQKPGSQKSGLWFWLPHVGFSSSVDETSAAPGDPSQSPAPVQTQPEARPAAQPPGRQEKASWFRFPKLGFSAPPAKSSPGVGAEGGAGPSEPTGQDETVAFFDARESLSPEEKEGGDPAEAAGAGQKEPTKNAGREPAPPAQRGPEKGEA
ncbi:protein AHNAK2 isoform X2 [Oryctolagus cuniculus]|uniref:protein AHNAK2 isoform X2 n=1 Tax=Oryctolagus cuniculus TaxID=9986 RepID=UPI003879498A